MKYKYYWIAVVLTVVYVGFHLLYLPVLPSFEYFSMVAESFIAVMTAACLVVLRKGDFSRSFFRYLAIGLVFLYVSTLTDALDEFFEHSSMVTALFEDISQIIGICFVIVGISGWVRHNAEQNTILSSLARVDHLTGLYNRRAFAERAEAELDRCRRYGESISLMLMDIDDLKIINDTYGHLVGDEILKAFSAGAAGVLRKSDVMARWGGDEFVALLPETDAAGCERIAEKLRAASGKIYVYACGKRVSCSLSIGVVSLSGDGRDTVDSLLLNADKALYRAKADGKNKVCVGG